MVCLSASVFRGEGFLGTVEQLQLNINLTLLSNIMTLLIVNISGCARMVRMFDTERGSCGSKNCARAAVLYGREVRWIPCSLSILPIV